MKSLNSNSLGEALSKHPNYLTKQQESVIDEAYAKGYIVPKLNSNRGYELTEKGKLFMDESDIVITIAGASASGKTSIAAFLLEHLQVAAKEVIFENPDQDMDGKLQNFFNVVKGKKIIIKEVQTSRTLSSG